MDKADLATMFGAPSVATFLGVPASEVGDVDGGAAILGAPCVTPYRSVGPYCADAPAAIRAAIAPYAASIEHVDFDLGRPLLASGASAVDCGDVAGDPDDPARNRARLHEAVRALLASDAVPVLLGGDDSAPIPLIEAYAGRGDLCVVQIDAHIDWRDEVDGERFGLSSTMRRASEMAHVKQIIQIGQRGIGSARAADLADARAWGVKFVSAQALHRGGIDAVLAHVPSDAQVLIALDIDGLDPSVVPGVIGRAPGGLHYWQCLELIHGIAARARLAGFSLVEYVPANDVDGLGALVCARIVANVIGLTATETSG